MNDPVIRPTTTTDLDAIVSLYNAAFPDEDLVPLVRQLQAERDTVLSLVACGGDAVVGHVALTQCAITGTAATAWLLGPLAVAPSHQRKGIGTELVHHSRHLADAAGAACVLVLGDPAYYGKHGFEPECEIAPPYYLPQSWEGAWQSVNTLHRELPVDGRLVVPEVWRDEKLWLP